MRITFPTIFIRFLRNGNNDSYLKIYGNVHYSYHTRQSSTSSTIGISHTHHSREVSCKPSFNISRCANRQNCDILQHTPHLSSQRKASSSSAPKRVSVMATRYGGAHSLSSVDQNFDFFLVLDFEATCDDKQKLNPQEIIEFPVLKVNAKTHKVESTFHQYISPQYHPRLTPFCTELTGIIQEMVDNKPHLPEVLQSFDKWMLSEGLLEPNVRSAFITCGDWDLRSMLPRQLQVLNLPTKHYFRKWINIKKSFADVTGTFPKGMMDMLIRLDLKHVGRHHSGIDDCQNIANILIAMLQKGYIFKENGRL